MYITMLKIYLLASLNYFKNHKPFLFINLIGLTTGLTAFYFAFLYVGFELSYDAYHQKAENIYRLVIDVKTPSGVDYRGTPPPLAQEVEATFPEVESATGILLDYLVLQNEAGVQNEEKIGYTDASLFSVFDFPIINRNPGEFLNAPFQVVLSQSCAEKYFGKEDPLGKHLLINGKDHVTVTGIMKDIPYNSHFRVDALVSLSTMLKVWRPDLNNNWKSRRSNTYLALHPDADPNALNAKITKLLRTKVKQEGAEYTTALEPLREVYLYGKPRGSSAGSAVTGNITHVYICSLAAILVLFIASLNYINLSTAFSIQRAKEIGVRKLVGASRSGLTAQFLTDVMVLSLMAFACSLGLAGALTPVFNQIAGKTISLGIWEHPAYLVFLFIVSVVTGGLSGLYPAFFLSAFQPIHVLKGRFASSIRGIRLRKTLVTSQFLLSFTLIVTTSVLYKQLHFMQNQELGFKKDHMLAVNFHFNGKVSTEGIKHQLMEIPGVTMASISSSLPGRANIRMETKIESFDDRDESANMDVYFVDYDFMHQYALEVIAGRPFDRRMATDSTQAMIVNEAAVKYLGYAHPGDIIGKHYSQLWRKGIIIGVVKDFHFQSFREEVQPLTMQIGGFENFLTLTVSPTHFSSTIGAIEKKWKSIAPDLPFTYFFTDDAYNAQYDAEQRFGRLFIILVSIAIIISCLGLFGLSVFDTSQRTKEIAIRKVLGLSPFHIVTLLTKDFLVLIAAGIFLGTPLAWYAMHHWLQEFAYRIDLTPGVFITAGFVLLLIAVATICFQVISAARAAPVRSLKME